VTSARGPRGRRDGRHGAQVAGTPGHHAITSPDRC
jgi:hypothetical protein